jgi:hypothetical protein
MQVQAVSYRDLNCSESSIEFRFMNRFKLKFEYSERMREWMNHSVVHKFTFTHIYTITQFCTVELHIFAQCNYTILHSVIWREFIVDRYWDAKNLYLSYVSIVISGNTWLRVLNLTCTYVSHTICTYAYIYTWRINLLMSKCNLANICPCGEALVHAQEFQTDSTTATLNPRLGYWRNRYLAKKGLVEITPPVSPICKYKYM